MSTKGLLERSVTVAGESVFPMVDSLQVLTAEIREIDPTLLNRQERDLLDIVKALDENLPLINIETAISAGGANAEGFPNLAIATYEMSIKGHQLEVSTDYDGLVNFREPSGFWNMFFHDGTLPARAKPFGGFGGDRLTAETEVPLVPLKLRKSDWENLFLLFEVPVWKRVVRPIDPYLLQHIAGLIYAVVGTWDVTEKEITAYQTARKLGI